MTTIPFVQPIPNTATRAERYTEGRALRAKAPRTSHGEWASASDRPDPISLLEESKPHPCAGTGAHPLWTHVHLTVHLLTWLGDRHDV
jgi:hypothetical protein